VESAVQHKQLISDALELSLRKKMSFSVYRLPGQQDITYIGQTEGEVLQLHDFSEIPSSGGFLISPFSYGSGDKSYLIKPDIVFRNKPTATDFNKINSAAGFIKNGSAHFSPEETLKTDYLRQIENTIDQIKAGEYDKVVLSRVKRVEGNFSMHLAKIFNLLCESYPNAFVYLLNFKDHCWAGATPEPLIFSEGDQLVTVSLAGTRPYNEDNLDITHWNQKERIEQEYVTQYIEDILAEYNIESYEKIGPCTKKAGRLLHLRTDFSFSLESIGDKLPRLINALHPTSAVCGMPMEKSLAFLKKTEKHNREYYAGYLGPVGIEKGLQLFVNLRCMKVLENQLALYVGGGITADSVPDDEWEETEIKAETLLSILNQIP
jgi:isochorismate synthase